MSRGQAALESKQWQARRTRFQQPRRRTWTTANQFPELRGGFRTHRPESRTGGERAARTVVRCEDEAHVDQAEDGKKQSKVDQTQMRMAQSQDDPAAQRREEVGKLQEDRQQGCDRESHLSSNRSCGEGKCRGSELYRRSPRRQRRHAIQSD